MRRIDFAGINRAALGAAESLCAEWCPRGKVVRTQTGPNWVCCNPVRDESNPSFSISLDSGAFFDYADPDAKGGDLIALYAYLYSVDSKAAARQLAQRFGLALYEGGGSDDADAFATGTAAPRAPALRPAPEKDKERAASPWIPIVPAPAGAGEPPKAHVARGRPEKRWDYLGADGELLGCVYRFVTSDGGKEVLPCVYARDARNGREDWHWMQWPMPRPLYGLNRLAAKASATVIVTEGEKCADVADAVLPDLASVSWSGGCKAEWKADWSPLAGRRVVLWPDCDSKRMPLTRQEKDSGVAEDSKPYRPREEQPGLGAMIRIAQKLLELGCEVWLVRVPEPGELPDGWDIADAVADGMTSESLADWITAHAERYLPPADEVGSPATPAGASDAPGPTYGRAQWRDLLLYGGERKTLIDCRENVYLLLQHHPALKGLVASDTFAKKIVKTRVPPWGGEPGEWLEHDDLRLGLWLAQAEYLRIKSVENLGSGVAWCAADNGFHPVVAYLESLEWDGIKRLDDWMSDLLGVEKSVYSTLAGRMFLIGMVARIFEPGCRLRSMPIFEGSQYIGKSTMLAILGGEWFADTPIDLNNKDSYQLIMGRWLYEIAELDSFNRAESTRMKAFISSPTDRFRAPYERAPKDHPRSVVFGGTTNQDEYFKDQTGNTRYWPLGVGQAGDVNLDGLAKMRDQLFAEAVRRYRAGQRWHPSREEQTQYFEAEQAMREIGDPWEPIIGNYLMKAIADRVTQGDILFDCLKVEISKVDGTRSMSTRIGNIMKRLGWTKRRESKGLRDYYYVQPEGWKSVRNTASGGDDEASF